MTGVDEAHTRLLKFALDAIEDDDVVTSPLLERRLGIGHARAARLLDELGERGYIFPEVQPLPPDVAVFRCGACEDHHETEARIPFTVTTRPGAISTHWCGARVRWTGQPPHYMKALSDPDDARNLLLLVLIVFPAVVALILAGPLAAGVVLVIVVVAAFLLREANEGVHLWRRWFGGR